MKIFDWMYRRSLLLARHRHAPYYLAGMSAAESVIFPIPPDVMLAPMVLANKERAWQYAFITSIASVVGGILGYFLGYFAIELVEPLILEFGYNDVYQRAVAMFQEWGIWIIFIAGFSPIPYKVFTVTAGALSMAFLPFVLASFIGRSARFYLVAALIYFGGPHIDSVLQKYVERIGWGFVILCVAIYLIFFKQW